MDDASPATFRPTLRQSVVRGLIFGTLIAIGGVLVALVVAGPMVMDAVLPAWLWLLLVSGPPSGGTVVGFLVRRRTWTQLSAGGIRIRSVFADGLAPWSRVVDMRAERRGCRTVVSVYLDSGVSVQLRAPYSGGLFGTDPQFERKMFALSHIWRSHRFGGLPG